MQLTASVLLFIEGVFAVETNELPRILVITFINLKDTPVDENCLRKDEYQYYKYQYQVGYHKVFLFLNDTFSHNFYLVHTFTELEIEAYVITQLQMCPNLIFKPFICYCFNLIWESIENIEIQAILHT